MASATLAAHQAGRVLSAARRGAPRGDADAIAGSLAGRLCDAGDGRDIQQFHQDGLGADAAAHFARTVNHADLLRARRSHSAADRRLSIPTGMDMLSLRTSVYGPTAEASHTHNPRYPVGPSNRALRSIALRPIGRSDMMGCYPSHSSSRRACCGTKSP